MDKILQILETICEVIVMIFDAIWDCIGDWVKAHIGVIIAYTLGFMFILGLICYALDQFAKALQILGL